MADVTVKYKGSTIAEMSEEGTKTLKTSGKYCEGDITVSYVPPAPEAVAANSKVFTFTSAAAVANKDVTVVSGDPDVAAHYADENALVTVRKVSNNNTRGVLHIMNGNRGVAEKYGIYSNYNLSAVNSVPTAYPLTVASLPAVGVRCNVNGDIIVHCLNTANNFGGADYIITFSW
jgi:hypothetical protein